MASKVVGKAKKKDVVKIIHPPFLKTNIKAQMASAAPPLGPQLGQRGLNVANFCKDFNNKTAHIKPGALLPTRIYIKPDRTYDLEICAPMSTYLLKKAAGINRAKQEPDEIAGYLSVKHIYEIAKVKSEDRALKGIPLKEICEMMVKTCRTCGIKVQREDLDPEVLGPFLEKRKEIVAQQLQAFADKKAAKMLRG
ncbi:unnamed protein product [Bursaphelenchus okinawaensis]|uniref:Large ribosomal subunit protein uL11m n=1 Tax=Bursaphelenchus okinawaensis TaxID=465554 RepID=A0A811KHJ3_9BILA|nr:unnamed protein product [Bursaphelenchus okinawaensis]CAG9103405.1 unnamed protein product [Bursaphelenchus okinawaensis]